MRTEDGARAWQALRRLPAYRYAWRRRRPPPGLPERAPFPVAVGFLPSGSVPSAGRPSAIHP